MESGVEEKNGRVPVEINHKTWRNEVFMTEVDECQEG